jgi:hypothetical protein
VADLKITQLAALAGADLAAGDLLAVADISASETKKITVTDFLGNASTLIADATIPGAKILFGSATVPGSALVNGAVDTAQLADGAVSAAKLADESTVDLVTALPVSGAFIGQIALDTDDDKAHIWDGSQWVSFKAAGSVNTVIGGSAGIVNLTVSTSGDEVTINTTIDNTTGAAEFLAGPTNAGGVVAYRQIASGDLPTAGSGGKGAVQVSGGGLTMNGDLIAIDNAVTPESVTYNVVQYDAEGLITDGRAITAVDLPIATSIAIGGVAAGTGLVVDNTGQLDHSNAVTASTGTKVTFDTEGHITATAALEAADIPSLDASKITSGEFATIRVQDSAITSAKLADYSTAAIANSAPPADYIGQLFFNPLDRTLFMWDGNVYQPIGVSYGQVIFAGTYDASTNLITSVTTDGTAIGLVVGGVLPGPSTANRAHYVVVDSSGTGTAPAPAIALQPPDILLSTGTDWTLLDVSQTVTAQLASNIQVSPAGTISSTNVQAALQELDTEKLPLTGGTLTGALALADQNQVQFREDSDNGTNFIALQAPASVSSDKTITLPDVTGTVVTSGDTGTVTSTMILDGTILNADINASAAIAGTKIAPDFGSQTVTTTGVISSALGAAATPSITFTGDLNTGIYSPGADQVAISTNGTGRLFVDASGNVYSVGPANVVPTGVARNFTVSTSFSDTDLPGIGLDQRRSSVGSHGSFFWSGRSTGGNARLLGSISLAQTVATSANGGGDILFNTNPGTAVQPIERLRITSDGRLGLGTSSPNGPIHVLGSTDTGTIHWFGTSSGAANADVAINFATSTNAARAQIKSTRVGSSPDGNLQFFTQRSGTLQPRMIINELGSVGIGTTSPGVALHVDGDIRCDGVYGETDTNTSIQFPGSDVITFNEGGSEAARIDSSGRLLVGTSSDSGGALLQVNGNRIRIATANTPASAGATGTTGEIAWDADYIYVCTATNTWKRTAISTW